MIVLIQHLETSQGTSPVSTHPSQEYISAETYDGFLRVSSQQLAFAGSPQQSFTAGNPQQSVTYGTPQQSFTAGNQQQSVTAGNPQQSFTASMCHLHEEVH